MAGQDQSQAKPESPAPDNSSVTQKASLHRLKTFRKNHFEELKRLIAARTPLTYLRTWEDDRALTLIRKVALSGFKSPVPLWVWSETAGLRNDSTGKADRISALEALEFVIQDKAPSGIYVFQDLPAVFSNGTDPSPLIRKLRDVHQAIKSTVKSVILTHPLIDIPTVLQKEIFILTLPLPTEEELLTVWDQVSQNFPKTPIELDAEQKTLFARTAVGMTEDEARRAFMKCFVGKRSVTAAEMETLYEEKSNFVRRDGILEFVRSRLSVDEIGGLETLKEWLRARAKFFTDEARSFGLQMPKGLLITGVSGCGKSTCAQAIASSWNLPLYRLDMGRIYGGVLGNPEESMRRAIEAIEAVAPAILWMEEIEKGVAGYRQGDAGVTARIFSSFLTWMQEKEAPVFIAATANEIQELPPELLRKGRFDEIFFVDLPSEAERVQIFAVHLKKRGQDPSRFSLINLAKGSTSFNGAEIEQVVVSGLFEAFNEKRPLDNNDLYKAIGRTVPLATTMSEAIKDLKRWADTRALRASKDKP